MTSRQESFVKNCLALEAWRWGHAYGGHRNMCLIAQCIANRVRSGWGDWLDVLFKIPVHAAVHITEIPTGFPELYDPNFIKLLEAIDGIYAGTAQDTTGGAFFWADMGEKKITRDWFLETICRNPKVHPNCGSAGTLNFFR